MRLDWRDRRLWVWTAILVLIALPLGFAYYGANSGGSAARPTPTPYPPPPVEGLWRIEGHVGDETGQPVPGVCLSIGPVGCQAVSPRSDKDGNFYFDLPPASVDYDLHFSRAGFQQLDVRIHPTGPSTFNYVLKRG